MFDTVAMSRLTVAAPVGRMADVLRACTELGCVHIESYTNFEDGVKVGQASASDEANHISSLLAKVRAAISAFNPVNVDGPVPLRRVKELLEDSFGHELQTGLDLLDTHRDAEAELEVLDEQIHLLRRLAPLNMDLELLSGSDRVEVYVAETKKASKAASTFGALLSKVELASAPGIVAVACMPSEGAEVQMALGEMGGKPVQIPSMNGTPDEALKLLLAKRSEVEGTMFSASEDSQRWARNNGRNILAIHEYLTKEDEIHTAPTQLAVSGQAFALDAWVPTSKTNAVKSALKDMASHVEVEAFVNDHHHDDHGDHHHEPTPPVALENDVVSRPFELMVGLVGRPTYGTFDPTFFLMLTFPMIYGLILGDFGYGFIIFLLGSHGIDRTKRSRITDTLNMSYMHIPFHRATSSLNEYVLLSVYLGVAHLMFGFILGFINVARAHGLLAAFFEKGSWIIILAAGTLHIYGFLTTDQGVFDATPYAIAILVGVVCLIIGLAVFEKFGLAGGLIMGPIETFGLLANTLSYLRVMGVGVAGVKIAEVSITMGWDLMWSGGGIISIVLGLVLFIFIQAFALALGLLSPSIHAARLHFVEWMGKFYDGSGRVFTPIGGRTLHTEGQS